MIIRNVALLSPSDVDRKRLEETIKSASFKSGNNEIRLDVLKWEDLPSKLDNRPGQYSCDDYLIDAEIVIAVFRSYAGTKFNSEKSATVHEINNALLKSIRKRYTGEAPHVMLYFCDSDLTKEKITVKKLDDLQEVLRIKEIYSPYGIHKTCKDEDELQKHVREDLNWIVDSIRGIHHEDEDKATKKYSTEYLAFIENLINEKVFSWLEMDNGYSERLCKLFERFYYEDGEIDQYHTNFIFNYGVLKDKKLTLLSDRFKDVFAYWVCEMIDIHHHNEAEEQGAYFEDKVEFANFRKYATIVNEDSIKSPLFSFEHLQESYGTEFVKTISEILMEPKKPCKLMRECPNLGNCPHAERCPSLLRQDLPLIFLTPMLTEPFLSNVSVALTTLTRNVSQLPKIFLLSVFESPSKSEFAHHIRNSKSNEFLRDLYNDGKLQYRNYFMRKDLENAKILPLVYQ